MLHAAAVAARRPLMIACLLAALCSALPPAHAAGDSAADFIEPRVNRTAFATFLDQLRMDDDQHLVASMLYSDYAAAIEEMAAGIDEQAEQAGRGRVQDALAGSVYIEPQELRRLRAAVLGAYQSGWEEADRLFQELIIDTHILLIDTSADDFERALRRLRRAVYLQPRQAGGLDEAYAGDGVDVAQLVQDASIAGGELESLDPGLLSADLDEYERQMDALLVATAAADRQGRMNRALARIERDRSALRGEEQAALGRWQRLYQVNRQAAQAIGAAAGRNLGEAARQRWLQRFDHACFPWLFQRAMPDRQQDWIARRISDDEIVQEAAQIQADYVAQRAALRREAIDLILRGRQTFRIMLHSRMDSSTLDDSSTRELYQDLLKNSGKRAKLDSDTSASLEALLTERQRRQMRSDIAAAAYGRRGS
jgi:hypothetical protein